MSIRTTKLKMDEVEEFIDTEEYRLMNLIQNLRIYINRYEKMKNCEKILQVVHKLLIDHHLIAPRSKREENVPAVKCKN